MLSSSVLAHRAVCLALQLFLQRHTDHDILRTIHLYSRRTGGFYKAWTVWVIFLILLKVQRERKNKVKA